MRRTLSTLTTVAAVLPVLLVTGCGSDNTTAGDSETTAAASATATVSPTPMAPTSSATADQGTVLNVKVQGDKVTPNGERVKAKVGKPVTINVSANRAGELHVHSTPEQELEYRKGKTTLNVTIDKPGIVDVEDHIADVVVVQLEVS
jgi:uncharacterized lipoprotein